MAKVVFWCNYANHMVEYNGDGVGYARPSANSTERICYECCAAQDKDRMANGKGRYTLYLVVENGTYVVTNWPGTLRYRVQSFRTGQHNWGLRVYHVWFNGPDGHIWHGVNIGDNQVCHCKRTAKKWRMAA